MCLAILSVLASVAWPMAQVIAQRHKEYELRRALIEIRAALDAYKLAADQGRIALSPGASGYPPNLRMLVDGVIDQRSPTRQRLIFMRRLPADPFAPESRVSSSRDARAQANQSAIAGWGLRSHASPPDAPTAGDDVFDVYSRSPQVGLNGVPYSQW